MVFSDLCITNLGYGLRVSIQGIVGIITEGNCSLRGYIYTFACLLSGDLF